MSWRRFKGSSPIKLGLKRTYAEVAEARQGDEVAAPVCIVAQDGDKLCVNPDGMALLQSLESVPVAVIAVAGLYRTGKSFFMNQLAGAKPRKKQPASGFRVGHDTESCTRGVWVWLALGRLVKKKKTIRLEVVEDEGEEEEGEGGGAGENGGRRENRRSFDPLRSLLWFLL